VAREVQRRVERRRAAAQLKGEALTNGGSPSAYGASPR
jgi:hypothetical protein